jgi:hypothetical protein
VPTSWWTKIFERKLQISASSSARCCSCAECIRWKSSWTLNDECWMMNDESRRGPWMPTYFVVDPEYLCTYIHVYVYMHIHVYVWMYACMHV